MTPPTNEQIMAMLVHAFKLELAIDARKAAIRVPPEMAALFETLRNDGLITIDGEWCKPTSKGIEEAETLEEAGAVLINSGYKQ